MILETPAICIGTKYCKYFTYDRRGINLVSDYCLLQYTANHVQFLEEFDAINNSQE